MTKMNEIENKAHDYVSKYWTVLRNVNGTTDLTKLMNEMLLEVKEMLSEFNYIDVYGGYQIIAEIWKNTLTHDTELIAAGDFYTVSRTREPNMITKGTGKKNVKNKMVGLEVLYLTI